MHGVNSIKASVFILRHLIGYKKTCIGQCWYPEVFFLRIISFSSALCLTILSSDYIRNYKPPYVYNEVHEVSKFRRHTPSSEHYRINRWGVRCPRARCEDIHVHTSLTLTRKNWVVNFKPRPLWSYGKNPWYLLNKRLGGVQSPSECSGVEKNLFK